MERGQIYGGRAICVAVYSRAVMAVFLGEDVESASLRVLTTDIDSKRFFEACKFEQQEGDC